MEEKRVVMLMGLVEKNNSKERESHHHTHSACVTGVDIKYNRSSNQPSTLPISPP